MFSHVLSHMSNKNNYIPVKLANDPYSQRRDTAKSLKQQDDLKTILIEQEIDQKKREMVQLVNQIQTNMNEAKDLFDQFNDAIASIRK